MIKILTSLLLIPYVAVGQNNVEQTSNTTNWKSLDHPSYSIKYPSHWELNESGEMGTSLIILSPLESEKDTFRENVNLLIQDLTGLDIDLDQYTKISEDQMKSMFTNYTLIENKRINKNNDEFHKVIYVVDNGFYLLQFEQYFRVSDDKAYVLTFTSEKEKFETYRVTGEKILNSFLLKK